MLLVDAGDALASPHGQIPNEGVLAALAAGGYAALNVGDEEVAWGLDDLRSAAAAAGLPLLSSNLIESATGQPAFAPELSLTVQGVRIALLGVIAPDLERRHETAGAAELTALDPAQALAPRVARLRPGHDLVVVLAQLTRQQGSVLAEQVPGIDVVVGGDERPGVPLWGPLVGVFWLQSKPYGKGIVMARIRVGPDAAEVLGYKEIPFVEGGPANAEVAQAIAQAQKPTPRPLSPLAAGYRGAETCRRCHGNTYLLWAGTPHAAAYRTLHKEKRTGDAACLTCHTTSVPGKPASTVLAGVQCEACHGPYADHDQRYIRGRQKAFQTDWKTLCVRCHDPANSPDFDLETYLPKARHTPPRPPAAAPAPTEDAPSSAGQ